MDNVLVVDPSGIAGGLAILWKRGLNVSLVRRSSFFIEVLLKDDETNHEWHLINLYASSIDSVRKSQWEDLLRYRQQSNGDWVLWGDFNDILWTDEKKGGRKREVWSLKVFRDFVERAIPVDRELWTDGYFSDIAKMVGGVWLSIWIQGAAAMSNMGMFVTEMSSDSFQLLGMAERGMLPEFFATRSRYGTPLVGILFSASGVVMLSWMSFQEIVAAENILYCFGMILEFIAFIVLRMKHPAASRPYKIPLGTVGSVLMCIPPTILIFVVLALSSLKVMVVSLVAVVIGLVMQPCVKHVKRKRWFKFSESDDLPDLHSTAQEDSETFIE
ncbi:hypothetical protein RHGRI_031189 [Rhododendron griersonianum]|uniref:Uncharacterized protein n=1 Tax=Rhododendron griersonianum TaxID=479676 RepID=A0AAV6ICW4_9ERIC|nr:hypothetical protein RHGRI_031189 [Rhododendron griersonianum]